MTKKNEISTTDKAMQYEPVLATGRKLMPCGSPHSCLDCRHSVMITDGCTYLARMTDGEVDYLMDELRGK